MDSCEVIVVDDSPTSSPAPARVTNNSNDMDLATTNDTLSWSQFTAKFISTTMNSVALNNDKLLNDNGYRTMNVAGYNSGNTLSNNYSVANNNLQRQYQSQYSQYKPINSQFTPYNYCPNTSPYYPPNFMHNFEVMKSYSYYPLNRNNTVLPVDMRQTKTNSYYYFDGPPSQTPLRLVNFQRNIPQFKEYPEITVSTVSCNQDAAAMQPEFVDVNSYVNYSTNVPPSNVPFCLNNQPSMRAVTREKRKTTNSTTAFWNEHRTVSITKMINGQPSKEILSSIEKVTNHEAEDSDDSDIIFIGQYKKEDKKPEIVLSSNCGEQDSCNRTNCDIKLEPKCLEICVSEETDKNTNKTAIAPRRNPKRQVQCSKKSVPSVNEILLTSKNKFKSSKKTNNKVNNKKPATTDKNLRRSLRTKLNCGAVYCPPSPLSKKHVRDWPAEGMHERPDYNPVTNTVEPFDSYIRNISNNTKSPAKPNGNNTPPDLEENATLAQLCHDMLHHVLAYVATVKVMQDQEDERKILQETDNSSKMKFLTNLALEKTDSFDERIWKVLTDTVKNINNPKQTDTKSTELRDLIENSILLYCFTNNVSRSNVSKYIASVNPAEVMQLSNEKFGLTPDAQ